MANSKLVVAKGGSVVSPDGMRTYLPGTEITPGMLDRRQVEEHLKSGFLTTERLEGDPDELVEFFPGREDGPAIPADGPIGKAASKWSLDPDGIRGKSLEELNVMIHERDSSVEPCDDVAEATAFLSQDYQAPE